MNLHDLDAYNRITIQCHDNPDADAIASGFALYEYFTNMGKTVAFIYGGRFPIQKSNLKLMLDKLDINIEYRADNTVHIDGLLLMVDCQYGAGNVTKFTADEVAVIDHHQVEMEETELCEIRSDLGSCSTLCWKMLADVGYSVTNVNVGTALYYGLYTDTSQFAEISHPLDLDMRDEIVCNKSTITLLRNSNISISELETAGIALIRNIYNEKYRFAIIKAGPCDPNILGVISDFLLQVDGVDVCVVYNEVSDGFKVSVRSCVREVKANELADYLCGQIGSGGGHTEKAGGFIKRKKYDEKYPSVHTESYFGDRIHQYFEETEIIYSASEEISNEDMDIYIKKKIPIGYVRAKDVFPIGTPINIRTLNGDEELKITEDLIIIIGLRGEIFPSVEEVFWTAYDPIDEPFSLEDSPLKTTYIPKITNMRTAETSQICEFAKKCVTKDEYRIYAKELDHYVKVFPVGEDQPYKLGRPGDYLALRDRGKPRVFVIDKELLYLTYTRDK